MKKIINKLLVIILAFFCIFSLVSTNVYATSISDIFTKGDNFINKGQTSSRNPISEGTMKNMSEILYNTLLVIAIVVAVIIGLVIGIKFMTGSVEEKAKVKETVIAYVAGCIVVFGAFTIWKVLVTILQSAS